LPIGRKGKTNKDLQQAADSVAHPLPTDKRKISPDLAAVINAWPDLPEAIRAGILAMVKATTAKLPH
jgi:hypothetical protein